LEFSGAICWITIYVDPKLGITTSGRAATIERAKEQFRQSWERVHAKQAFEI
jgi:hypothetical protein